LTNGIHYQVHSNRSSQSLGSPQLSHREDASQTILKEILTYPWSNDLPHTSELDPNENLPTTSVIADEFQPDFYYLCPLKNTTISPKPMTNRMEFHDHTLMIFKKKTIVLTLFHTHGHILFLCLFVCFF